MRHKKHVGTFPREDDGGCWCWFWEKRRTEGDEEKGQEGGRMRRHEGGT